MSDNHGYQAISVMMHKRLEEMREKYDDSDQLNQQLLDQYLKLNNKNNGE